MQMDNGFQNNQNLPTANNNPGDLRFIGQQGGFLGKGGFAAFPDPKTGFGALLNDVQTKITNHPDWSLGDFSNVYAPPSENDTAQYTANLANKLNVPPDTKISTLQPNIGNFAEAIASNEGYSGALPNLKGQGGSDSAIPTANASTGGGTPSSQSSGPSFWDWLTAGAAATGGYLLGHAKDVAPLAAAGIGTAVAGPEGGIIADLGVNAIENLLGGGGNNNQPPTQTGSPSAPQEPNYNQIIQSLESTQPQSNAAAKQIADTQQQAMQTTFGGRQMLQDPNITNGITANSKYGFSPQIDQTGSMNWQPAMQQSQQTVADLSQKVQDILHSEGSIAPVAEAQTEAKKMVRERLAPTEWEQADKEIDSAGKSYHDAYGDGQGNMSLGHFQQMKQETGHGKKWGMMDTTTKKEAYKALSSGARRTIEKHTQNKDLYNRVMKEEQNLINGQKVMNRLNGKKAPKNEGLLKHLFHHAGRYTALAIGDKIGGPIGAILGSMVGDHVVRAVDKKFGKTVFETPAMHRALQILSKENPKSYQVLEYVLRKEGIAYPKRSSKFRSVRSRTPLQATRQLSRQKATVGQSVKPKSPTQPQAVQRKTP